MDKKKDNDPNEFLDPEDWEKFSNYLLNNNRFILSDYWEKFVDTIVNTAHKRTKTLKKNKILYRARIGSSFIELEDGDTEFSPIHPENMGSPPVEYAKAGRLNPERIPYLYLATTIETAVAEVRPWIKSNITIGYFKIDSDLKILDTSHDEYKSTGYLNEWIWGEGGEDFIIQKRSIPSFTAAEKEEYIWGDINNYFSKPISPNDSPLKYLSTQFLSEKLKNEGYDGIGYKSSLNDDGYNVVLFNSQQVKCIKCGIYEIKKLNYEFEEIYNPIFVSDDKNMIQRVISIGPLKDNNKEK
ncbi:MAG TPA: RES family NAD+ phosphorylase [Gammaproteobacteria bacterium]|jgi:hypothetical protein|nr:RES family NAD+ phosphorylase [Nitrosomonas sp.]HQW57751.1 RES family NAD+ phosphorylase [Gammaproteobacteria bacterium]HRB97474.1 RES family NAD+ phosphorylase [Nitrosomonas sp.]